MDTTIEHLTDDTYAEAAAQPGIMVIDFWRKGVRYQLLMFVIVLVLTVVGFIPIAYFILEPVLPFLHSNATTIAK